MTAHGKGHDKFLIPYYRGKSHWEADKAGEMFQKFVSGEFSYDDISSHPDYMVYASAEVLAKIFPLMIDEMLLRNDTGNFLIYPMITAVDIFGDGSPLAAERTQEFAQLTDKQTVHKILLLLTLKKEDPPVPVERLDRIIAFWRNKATPPQP